MGIGTATAVNQVCMASLYVLIILLPHCTATDILSKDSPISLTQTLVSDSQVYELGFFNPDNSTNRYLGIWFKNITVKKVIWVANRENPLSVSDNRSSLTIGNDGNLRILDGDHNTVWSTNVRGQFNETIAQLTDMGDFCINDTFSGSILWESFDYPSNSLLPGMKLGIKGNTQGKQLLSSWKSNDDPTPGSFVAGLSAGQPPQVFVWHNSKPNWRGGSWDGGKFIGIPEQEAGYSNQITLMPGNSQEGAYLTLNLLNSSDIRWLYLQPDGVLQMIKRDDGNNKWDSFWEAPANRCDVYGVCGAFAICTSTKYPICECLKGFVPQSNDEWSKGNWTRGCVRRSELLCEKNETSLASRIDCMVWTEELIDIEQFSEGGENLLLRLSYADSGEETNVSPAIISLATIGRKTNLDHFNSEDEIVSRDTLHEDVLRQESFELPIFEFKQIMAVTDHFSYRNKLGEGGFGAVYKGMLDGQQVAVKRLSGMISEKSDVFSYGVMLLEIMSGKRNTEFIHQEQIFPLAHGDSELIGGYMSPEYAMGGVISEKSDVFSYGVMLLEIMSGKRNTEFIHQEQIYPLAHDLPKDRPTMTEAVSMLCSETELPEPKEPLFTLQRLSGSSTGQELINIFSINAVTISMIEGR
ncbi:hypothetical protein L1987_58760 [Smallanthus sonchifolius]|uniref:Uncharacterized protein n=1 Tax=Smallanthus sonchifolius TaxID=185202 RepID=A0ACB9D3X4_9ASTR|nr:hypothetical protein L1987_58760 [Smallanthus sonchifolius]